MSLVSTIDYPTTVLSIRDFWKLLRSMDSKVASLTPVIFWCVDFYPDI